MIYVSHLWNFLPKEAQLALVLPAFRRHVTIELYRQVFIPSLFSFHSASDFVAVLHAACLYFYELHFIFF